MEIWTENFEQIWGMGLRFWNMEPEKNSLNRFL